MKHNKIHILIWLKLSALAALDLDRACFVKAPFADLALATASQPFPGSAKAGPEHRGWVCFSRP